MFKKILHSIFSHPWAYNQLQNFFGANKRKRAVQHQLRTMPQDAWILDLGGGTGLYRDIWPKDCRYICLDNDLIKLKGFSQNGTSDYLLLADATRVPIKNNSIDIILCNSMSHHLPQEVLEGLLKESGRILKDAGQLFFLDAVLRRESLLNRFLWSLDRGEYPHTQQTLSSLIKRCFIINYLENFSHFYDFVLFVCTKTGTK